MDQRLRIRKNGFCIVLFLKFFHQGLQFFSIKARLKNKKQGLIDLEPVFNRDQDRDENFKIRV